MTIDQIYAGPSSVKVLITISEGQSITVQGFLNVAYQDRKIADKHVVKAKHMTFSGPVGALSQVREGMTLTHDGREYRIVASVADEIEVRLELEGSFLTRSEDDLEDELGGGQRVRLE